MKTLPGVGGQQAQELVLLEGEEHFLAAHADLVALLVYDQVPRVDDLAAVRSSVPPQRPLDPGPQLRVRKRVGTRSPQPPGAGQRRSWLSLGTRASMGTFGFLASLRAKPPSEPG